MQHLSHDPPSPAHLPPSPSQPLHNGCRRVLLLPPCPATAASSCCCLQVRLNTIAQQYNPDRAMAGISRRGSPHKVRGARRGSPHKVRGARRGSPHKVRDKEQHPPLNMLAWRGLGGMLCPPALPRLALYMLAAWVDQAMHICSKPWVDQAMQ